ncbi:MAG: GntR family transcriptional regulator [Anaerolineales bacterium]|nr:GntR family transcriptional regulator [Anaerolineales bacterium]
MFKIARTERKTLTEVTLESLRAAIAAGTYQPGSQLPTEAELVEMLGVSRTVVREALRALEEGGLVARRQGVGTFVREQAILKNLNFNYGITEMIESAGHTAGTSYLYAAREPADAETAAALALAEGDPVFTVTRARTADGRPVVYTLDTLSVALLPKAGFDADRLLTASIYTLLQAELSQPIEYGVARLLPAHAPAAVAEQLALPPAALVLYLVQTDYAAADKPLLYSREYHLPDAFDFLVWRRGPARVSAGLV